MNMKKVILVDGNNLLYRSYYATAYNGNMMMNSKNFPTNALYGFVNMMNKIIDEEKPTYIMVAFDKGKTFRHDKYETYKAGRSETPDELKMQFPKAKEILDALGIKYYEIDNYEADDIIGTFASKISDNDEYAATIISSDKDLLQLITDDVEVKLLKTKDYIRMNKQVFIDTYGIEPIKMIDLKALMGDSSDNIPGVKGIGEKTALKLLTEYKSLENIYDNIDSIKGSVKDKLITYKDDAYMSKDLATIYKEVPLDINFDDIKYTNGDLDKINLIYNELEFYSLLKKNNEASKKIEKREEIVKIFEDLDSINTTKPIAVYLDLDDENYHHAKIKGMAIYNSEISGYIPYDLLLKKPSFLTKIEKYTYDLKKLIVSLKKEDINFEKCDFDLMIAAYLLNYNVKDDISYLANSLDYEIPFFDKKEMATISFLESAKRSIDKAKFIYEVRDNFLNKIRDEKIEYLYNEIEIPLSRTLANMEYTGIRVDKDILKEMRREIKTKLELLSNSIYNHAGEVFNISSPRQLGEILFEKLKLPYGKKNKTGYTTDANVLNKLKNYHPIVNEILEYRMLTKLLSTYIEGILNAVLNDGKIHTIYTQTLTRTGRLSSIEPNLQNIPIRYEYGRLIRKCFIPEKDFLIMSCDYSQIELRIFAHMAGIDELIKAFNDDMDIHTKTAMDIFKVSADDVTKDMRRKAKAVNFGILYGISGFGLAEDLGISPKEGKDFIEEYLKTYPGVSHYMKMCIKNAHECGYVKTIMNRKRVIPELNNKNRLIVNMGERMALNTPIQGSSADILKKAMNEIDDYFSKHNLKSKMILQIHDELVFNVHKDELMEVKNIVKDIMENTYKLSVPLKVDIEVGYNLYEAK